MKTCLLTLLLVAACGAAPAAEAPQFEPAGAPPPSVSAALKTPAAPPPGLKLGDYALVFKSDGAGWANQVVIAPWGDVVVLGGHSALLLARDSGKVLLRAPVCFTQAPDAAAFIDEHHLLVTCAEGVDELTFPQGTVKRVFEFKGELGLGAIGGGRLVAAADGFFVKNDPMVRVYAVPGFQQVDEFDAGGRVRAVGVSSDGRFAAAGLEGTGIVVRDTSMKSSKTYLKDGDHTASPVRFSPDASSIFTSPGSFVGGELALASGEVVRRFKASSWIKTVRYIDATRVLVTGAEGLVLYSGAGEVTNSPVSDLGEGLDLSTDGSFFCAAGRGGTTACFSQRPVPPSTFVAWTGPSDPRPAAPSIAPAAVTFALDGRIVSRAGKTLVVSTPAASTLKVGARGKLSKHFTSDVGIRISGEIVIATVEVRSADGDKVTLTILEEKSPITINGNKKDHFRPGSYVTLKLD